MKWNGSIYYNGISQDNVGVDKAALSGFPAQSLPSLLPEGPGPRRSRRNLARPPCNTNSSCPLHRSFRQATEERMAGEVQTRPEGAQGWRLTPHRDAGGPSHPLPRQFSRGALTGQGRDNTLHPWALEVQHAGVTHLRGYCEEEIPTLPFYTEASPLSVHENHLGGFEAPETLLQPQPDELQPLPWGES